MVDWRERLAARLEKLETGTPKGEFEREEPPQPTGPVSFADLLDGTGIGRPPEREPELEPVRIDMRTQKQRALEQQRWARKHPQEYKKLVSLHGKPAAQKEYRESLRAKEQKSFEQKQVKAQKEWRQQTRAQYPIGKYLILWRGAGKAEIFGGYRRPVTTRFTGGLKLARLERGALDFWKAMQTSLNGAVLRSPFKPISRRAGSLAETDIPRDVEKWAASMFSWREEHLTPKEFEERYGPFEKPLGLVEGARITHVRKTGRGYGLKYLEPFALDVTKPWGVTEKDVEALEKRGKLFAAHLARGFMAGGIWQKAELTPEQFRTRYGVSFELPKESLITSWRRGPKGYEIKYMPEKEWEALPSYVKEEREPTFWEVPLTEHFRKFMTTPRLKGYGEPDSKILGGPIGGTFATERIAFAITLAEATVGEYEEHVLKKATIRSGLMTHEQLALSYGVIAAVVGVKYGPRIVKGIYKKGVPSHLKYVLSEKAFALKMRTIVPFYKKVISPAQLRLEHVYHEAMYKTPKWLGTRVFGPQRYGEIQAVLRTPYGTYESFHYAFPWKATPYKKYPAWLIEQARLRAQIQAIETSLAWGKTAYPSYGVSIEKVAKPLTLEQTLAQAERVPTYRTEYTPRLGMVKGKPEYTFTSWSVPTGKETMFTERAALEFEQSLQRAMPTRYYIPATKGMTWQTFKGAPTTPFEQSLSKAITAPEKIVKGGKQFLVSELTVKPATYKIAERVMKEMGIAQTKTATTSFMRLRETVTGPVAITKPVVETAKKAVAPTILHPFLWRGGEYPSKYAMEKKLLSQRFEVYPTTKTIFKAFPKLTKKEKKALQKAGFTRFATRTIQRQKQKQIQKLIQSQALEPKQMQSLVQRQAQIQVVRQEQALKLRRIQLSVTAQIQSPFLARPSYVPRIAPTPTRPPPQIPPIITPPYVPPRLRELQRRAKRGPRWGAWFYREHAVARPKDVVRMVTGRPRRKTGLGDFNRIKQAMHGSRRRKPRGRNQLNDLARKLKKVI